MQAYAVWSCDEQERESRTAGGDGSTFVYHRYTGKYCLRRGHGATCVQEAADGSRLLLRRATSHTGCLVHAGVERRVLTAECVRTALFA